MPLYSHSAQRKWVILYSGLSTVQYKNKELGRGFVEDNHKVKALTLFHPVFLLQPLLPECQTR